MLELTNGDQALLDGGFGPAAAHAMRMLVRYAEAVRADRFVSIQSAHIDGCLYHGPSSIDFIKRYTEMRGRVRVPTTLNVAAVDVVHPGWHQGPPELIPAQAELTRLHEMLGCLPTMTCAPYQRMLRPSLGDHVAWAESNAIVFVNSVLGARTDRYGDFTDLCAALTGRVPCVGLHCDENRIATVHFDVIDYRVSGLPRDLYFACLGYVVGARAAGRVPVLTGMPLDASEDELKAFGAAAASSGSLAIFHAVGITPEAPTLEAAAGGYARQLAHAIATAADLAGVVGLLCPLSPGEPIAAVCLGTPHYSLTEFACLAALVEGRHLATTVEMYVSTSREIASIVAEDVAFAAIALFGVRIVVDTCTYLAPVVRETHGVIVTNSVKWAHYGPGNIKRRTGLMTLERCIRSAELGRVAA